MSESLLPASILSSSDLLSAIKNNNFYVVRATSTAVSGKVTNTCAHTDSSSAAWFVQYTMAVASYDDSSICHISPFGGSVIIPHLVTDYYLLNMASNRYVMLTITDTEIQVSNQGNGSTSTSNGGWILYNASFIPIY